MKRNSFRLAGAACLGLGLFGCASMDSGAGLTRLIDGQQGAANFALVGPASWASAEGALQLTQAGKDAAFLVTKHSYRDFVLRVEFWASDDANSGVFFRCQDPQKINFSTCYEANIYDQAPEPHNATGAIVNVAKVAQPARKAGGQWNTFEITAKGQKLTVVFNGVKSAEVQDDKHAQGPVALQWARGTVKFRKLEIQAL